MDALGAASRATFGVIVSAYVGGVEDLSDLMDEKAAVALAAGDTDTVMQVSNIEQDGFCGYIWLAPNHLCTGCRIGSSLFLVVRVLLPSLPELALAQTASICPPTSQS